MEKAVEPVSEARNDAFETDEDTLAPKPGGDEKSDLYRKNLFGKVPRAVARDKRLSPTDTVVLVHRTLFTEDFVPRESVVRKIVTPPLGKDAIRRSIARLRDQESPQAKRKREREGNSAEPELLGYLSRRQRLGQDGHFFSAQEKLRLPKCKYACLVPREWFDGRFSRDELAALIYIQAGTKKGGRPYVREIANRFGWTRQKAAKLVSRLIKKEYLQEIPDERRGGRFAGVRYDLANRKTVDVRRVKRSGNGATGNGKRGNILRLTSHILPTEETHARTVLVHRGKSASRRREAFTPNSPSSELGSINFAKALRELVASDGARALHEKLHTDTDGLRRLVRAHGLEILDTIRERLTGFMIDGCEVGKITSWGYFVKAQQDENFASELAANGLRPGDVPGWRQFKPANDEGAG